MYKLLTINNEDYKLKLNTQNIIDAEEKIGMNLILIFGVDGRRLPTTKEMMTIFFHSLQAYQHGIKYSDACSLFDSWIEEGHTTSEFIPILFEIFRESGIIKNKESKN